MNDAPSIIGMGWATPFGRGIEPVLSAISRGEFPHKETAGFGGQEWQVLRVPSDALTDVQSIPRLRRSGRISLMAVAAARDAVAALPGAPDPRLPIIFATSNGGVSHTQRFYSGIHRDGPGGGSPILFPETVYNAPASHVAADLGLCGESTSLVGDSAVSFVAMELASEMIATRLAPHVLVIAADEFDGVALDGLARWGVVSNSSETPPCEGASAVVLGPPPSGAIRIQDIRSMQHAAMNAPKQSVQLAQLPGASITHGLARKPAAPRRPNPFGEGLAFTSLALLIIKAHQLMSGSNDDADRLDCRGFTGTHASLVLTRESGSE